MSAEPQKSVPAPILPHAPDQLVAALQGRIAGIERARQPTDEAPVSSGCEALDRLLPEGGFRRGTLVEWLADGEGTGRETLALGTVRQACREGGVLVVLDSLGQFYPPEAVRQGIALGSLMVVRAGSQEENHWALDQALRCPAVALVLAWPEILDGRTFRRLQLAAEEGGGLGLLMRPDSVRGEPSWADVRLGIEPLPSGPKAAGRRLRVRILRSRRGASGQSVEIEINDETHAVSLAPQLAHPADYRSAAGA